MSPPYKKSLFIFRRDLRIEDNLALLEAIEESQCVIPAFIFDPKQIEPHAYRSDFCLRFMIESLEDLAQAFEKRGAKLFWFHGSPEEIVEQCIKKLHIEAVFAVRDYTPYSLARDGRMQNVCSEHQISCHFIDDSLLNAPEKVLKSDQKPYTIFTPYFRNASKLIVAKPKSTSAHPYFQGEIPFSKKRHFHLTFLPSHLPSIDLKGGRKSALIKLEATCKLTDYSQHRDFPIAEATSSLSSYLKFNVCSIREVYHAIANSLGRQHPLIRSLYWRDFFTHIAFFFPHVFSGAFHKKYDAIAWSRDKTSFECWKAGQTGFPIVDAGMRQLKETGSMPNRLRMIVASFLTKDLHLDWRLGEQYFAQSLIDYDPCVNNGNWQWAASTGCDATPYFRIFNPWLQQQKFDPECLYIKRWVPELASVSASIIHRLAKTSNKGMCFTYPQPMVDHQQAAQLAIKLYSQL